MAQIALVEDVSDSAELLQIVLQLAQHSTQTYPDGPSFLNDFRAGKFELIILDIRMPEMDGFQVYDELRKIDPKVPVLAVSAEAHELYVDRAMRLGFCQYLTKPIMDIDLLREAVDRCLAARDSNKSTA
jgi:CheY-like chemotaxis protein